MMPVYDAVMTKPRGTGEIVRRQQSASLSACASLCSSVNDEVSSCCGCCAVAGGVAANDVDPYKVDPYKVDMWSLGVMLLQMVTAAPVTRDNMSYALHRLGTGKHSKDLVSLLGSLLEEDPQARPSVEWVLLKDPWTCVCSDGAAAGSLPA